MSFSRNETQQYIESRIGCYDFHNLKSYKPQLQGLVLSSSDQHILTYTSIEDATAYYMKALISYCQALGGISNHEITWSIIRLYYSMFYLLRCEILLSGHIIFRCGGFYVAKASEGESFRIYNPGNVSGDHATTIKYAEKLSNDSVLNDPMFGNSIDGVSVFTWAMQQRERVNYHQKYYSDPAIDQCVQGASSYIFSGQAEELLYTYLNDSAMVFCFDLNHIMTSVPFRMLISYVSSVKATIIEHASEYIPQLVQCKKILKKLDIKYNTISSWISMAQRT